MHDISIEILRSYQARKTQKQKRAFRNFLIDKLAQNGIESETEVSPFIRSTNIIVGDVDSAEFIFTAHYDTQAELPFPIIMSPFGVRGALTPILLIALIILTMFLITSLFYFLFPSMRDFRFFGPLLSLGFMYMIFFGKTNKCTANDNTSGVCVLVDSLLTSPESIRNKAAFVFFDNEELGMQGSSFFKKKHKKRMRECPLINFDCVGDGHVLAFMVHKAMFSDDKMMNRIRNALPSIAGKETLLSKAHKLQFTSDQMLFPKAMGVAAFKKSKVLGLYIGRIHTRRDIMLDEQNLYAMQLFVQKLLVHSDKVHSGD